MRRAWLAWLVAAVLACVPSVALAEPGAVSEYVALGDSYTAGSFIPEQRGTPPGCERSDRNYPTLLRAALRAPVFRDVSCGGATTGHLTTAQWAKGGANPPQLDAVTGRTDLVTIGIGANDIGFAEIVTTCTRLSPSAPRGAACRDHYTSGGRDRLADRIGAAAPRVAEALRQVRARAPHAKVIVVGYPTILPVTGHGCPPVSAGDADYLGRTFQALNDMIAAQAGRVGVRYLDLAGATVGHDVCQPVGVKWVEGARATSPAAPWHPNELGMRHAAALLLGQIR
ncbi:SGNH/GDSL hydrolase family protein [Pseudonocardia acaciae]|uniref:SGNH/GDSL hydrolase family protein n=1 Tax=Pseudonocardia acaciae TaxID=551276 RepID=UPI00048C9FFD|nr:SGNH/GDSL hydrolase family protein [Pseudonocardia acaciae]